MDFYHYAACAIVSQSMFYKLVLLRAGNHVLIKPGHPGDLQASTLTPGRETGSLIFLTIRFPEPHLSLSFPPNRFRPLQGKAPRGLT